MADEPFDEQLYVGLLSNYLSPDVACFITQLAMRVAKLEKIITQHLGEQYIIVSHEESISE